MHLQTYANLRPVSPCRTLTSGAVEEPRDHRSPPLAAPIPDAICPCGVVDRTFFVRGGRQISRANCHIERALGCDAIPAVIGYEWRWNITGSIHEQAKCVPHTFGPHPHLVMHYLFFFPGLGFAPTDHTQTGTLRGGQLLLVGKGEG
jgi:hypothetical protein